MDGRTLAFDVNAEGMVDDNAMMDEKYDSLLSSVEDTCVGVYLSIIYTFAFVLNTSVIYTCLRNWSCLVISDLYILSLASSDVLITVTAYPFPIISSFAHGWSYGNSGCAIYGFLSMYFAVVSMSTLAIMGVVRYISICHPHINVAGIKIVVATVSFPYIYSLFWSLMPLTGIAAYAIESYGTSCTLRWEGNSTFITLMVVCCIFTPLLSIIFSYGQILRKFRGSNRNIRRRNKKSFRMARKQKFLIKIVFTMCFGFLLSWMPYAIVSLWSAYVGIRSIPMRIRVISVLLARTSTVTNPIIYFLMSKKFRPLLIGGLCQFKYSQKQSCGRAKKANTSVHQNAVTGFRIVRETHIASTTTHTGTRPIIKQDV